MQGPSSYLHLYDYRRRVFDMYRERNRAIRAGEHPEAVWQRYRERRDRLFAEHPQSALSDEQKLSFRGLSYFPYNPAVSVEASVDTDVEPQALTVPSSGDEEMPMNRAAILRFIIDGHDAELSMYWINVYGGGLFLPFRDTTAPTETYGGGRYLFDTVKGSDFVTLAAGVVPQRILLDFNYAYNPSCAYHSRWVCPLAPAENRLHFPVAGGEKMFESPDPMPPA